MQKLLLTSILSILGLISLGQENPQEAAKKLGHNPYFIIDNQRAYKSDLAKYSPELIASITVFYDTSAIKLYGDSAKDGAVIIETKTFAKTKFIAFFRESSKSFDSLYASVGTDSSFQYILNDKIKTVDYEGTLSGISKELLIDIEILTKEQLLERFKIEGKQFGILIHARKPKNLYNADKKF